ncbi:glycosyltransferase family 4 protein [Nocardia bovistercoris]|uniref:Glycosyltransferase family 4 protein n=1 Tax=Nocardia bovistercoris TaxID=2785916 RepID=A0A931N1R7_9NOCA|nr:glycosyltransferase family 4 protein [Nocardia bovistercoris]MBH0774743.1 glycosyltransferase family 4 protein [Nocardia bovistercoris]
MTGSEWFGSAPGGLNRYFTDLYAALAAHPDARVSAAAFGAAPEGATSWGPTGGSTLRRARTAYLDRDRSEPAILDRHFALYGPRPRGEQALVVHFHGPWAAESQAAGAGPLAVRAKFAVERMRAAGARRFVVLSEHFRDLLVERYGVRPEAVRVVPPGVDLERFRPRAPERAAEGPVVLCVRRLEHRMGIDVLLRGWPSVVAARPDAELVIVGTGTAEAHLRELARTCADTVTFAGHTTDEHLTELYARAHCTVVPSLTLEGFGLIALESLASGRAPIVTDCGGLPDSVRALDPSLIVPSGDAEALAARLITALDGDLPDAERCRMHAETFSWSAAADRHIALYRELIG